MKEKVRVSEDPEMKRFEREAVVRTHAKRIEELERYSHKLEQ